MKMRNLLMGALALGLVVGCTDPSIPFGTSINTITVGATCSPYDAVNATNNPGQVFGGCAIASATMPNVIDLPTSLYDMPVRLNVNRAVTIQGDCSSHTAAQCTRAADPVSACSSFPILDMDRRDRGFLISVANVKLRCMIIRDVCPNGGNCSMPLNGSVPTGGGWYALRTEGFEATAIIVDGGEAAQGCGWGLCSGEVLTPSTQPVLDSVVTRGCVAFGGGGGGGVSHVDMTIRNSRFLANRTRTGNADGGNLKIYGGRATLENNEFIDGVAEATHGGNISIAAITSQFATSSAPIVVDIVGGSIGGGVANGNGGDIWAAGGTLQDVTVNVRDVTITDGFADSPASYPPGNGGLLAAADSVAGHLATIRLHGSTTLTGGLDQSAPRFDQMFGRIEDLRDQVVCGDGTVGNGEECDDGNMMSNDGCSAQCTAETCAPVCTEVCQ